MHPSCMGHGKNPYTHTHQNGATERRGKERGQRESEGVEEGRRGVWEASETEKGDQWETRD